jgi:hypothetical protein
MIQEQASKIEEVQDIIADYAQFDNVSSIKNDQMLSKKIMEGSLVIEKTDSVSMQRTSDLLKDLINKQGYYCIYITFNRPFVTLLKTFRGKGIKTENIYFFDAVTRLSINEDSHQQCSFVDSPKHLEYLLIYIKRKLDLVEGKKVFLIFDSLTNVMHYNSNEKAIHFIHALINKLRLVNVGGQFLFVGCPGDRNNVAYSDFKNLVDLSIVF